MAIRHMCWIVNGLNQSEYDILINDNSGFLNRYFQSELTWFFLISAKGQNPTEDEIEDMIEDADEDGSGSINFPEFVGLMMKKQEGTISKEEIKQVPTTKKNSIECLFCFVL